MSFLLYADDHAHMRTMVRDLLAAEGHTVTLAADGVAALSQLGLARAADGPGATAAPARLPDLMVLDVMMPGLSGLEVCRRVKAHPRTAGVPVLMLTGEGTIDDKVAGFDAGADDYLAKPFHPRELRARVDALLRLVRREGDRNPTSGLPGSAAIEAALYDRAGQGQAFAACYLDLDHFKAFNDAFGFAAADGVIRDAGTALHGAVSDAGGGGDDFVGHVGGDDFLVVTVPERAVPLVEESARRFRALVAARAGSEAAARGSYRAADREGRVREYMLPALTAAVVLVDPATWDGPEPLGARAADVKRRAKAAGGAMGGAMLIEAL
jgi:DNA-binding response OmpR family regulator